MYYYSIIEYDFSMRRFIKIISKGSILLAIIISLIIFSFLKRDTNLAEAWTRGIGRGYFYFISNITSNIPFSLTELFFVIIIALCIFLFVRMIINFVKIKPLKGINNILSILLVIFSVIEIYTITCEFAYNRKPVDLPFYEEQVYKKEFVDIYNYYAEEVNECISNLSFDEYYDTKVNYSLEQTGELVKEEYKKLTSDYYSERTVNIKRMLSSFLYRELNITGYTFMPLGEANIDYLSTQTELPFVIAHELAHTKGVMREDDANQVAFYICLNSDNYYLKYSALSLYFYQIRQLSSSYYLTDEERDKLIDVNPIYKNNIYFISEYWKRHNMLENIGDFFNDLYIKMSGIEEGTSSYSGGTDSSTDEETHELINPSKYQKLFFEKYYRNKKDGD